MLRTRLCFKSSPSYSPSISLHVASSGLLNATTTHADADLRSKISCAKETRCNVYADAVWSEVERFGKRRLRSKIAKRQRKLIRKVKNELRASYLSACTPSLYQYIIIFLISSVLGCCSRPSIPSLSLACSKAAWD